MTLSNVDRLKCIFSAKLTTSIEREFHWVSHDLIATYSIYPLSRDEKWLCNLCYKRRLKGKRNAQILNTLL